MGNVEKSRQRRSRPFAVLTYKAYAPRVKRAAALLDELFGTFPYEKMGRGSGPAPMTFQDPNFTFVENKN